MNKSTRAVIALFLPLAFVAASCGSDKASTASGGVVTSAPTKIGPTIKLKAKPEKKKVAWLECELPSCTAITPGFKDTTAALGWDLDVIPVGSFTPGQAFQQALDNGADFVAITGTPAASMKEQIDAAAAKGVGFGSCYDTTVPDEKNHILIQCGDSTGVAANGALISNWIIKDSGGKAHTLIVNIPDFPVLVSEADGAKEAYKANCAGCKVDELNVTIDQLIAAEIPAAVVSAVQKDKTINYLHFAFGDLPGGVLEALTAAGLDKQVKLTGVDASTAVGFAGIVSGTHAAWTVNPKPYAGWLMVDAFARMSVGMENTEERANAKLPTFVVADKKTAEEVVAAGDNGWPGPKGMEDQFKTLWGV
jgi:ribose transport system substrate-binding protein